ncbi:AzlC family ABC transporter permease [Lactobacillus sp. DCY120]|uniref:AzlC family ABC transporter permease n=1 Tax=Bombilactobacillus apium TaxID=2675299 RepID=A0A850R098_9LACO|nr:AzlC family ABC transporter permease [Bombilactobacillus apium]NVY96469.1 AzlC family ABC transporter permease [Bombilactobacillus apium]
MNEILDARSGFKETIPTMLGYIGIGISYGIVGRTANLSWLIITLISVIVYAGSAQFIMVGLLALHSPILSIILAVFLVNARMILMSTTIAPYLTKVQWWQNILLGTFLTDESFALAMNKLNYTGQRLNFSWLNAANLGAYLTWVGATLVGALLGNLITNPNRFGLDFAVVAMFIGLLYFQVAADRSLSRRLQLLTIALCFVLTYLGLIFIPSNLVIVVVTLAACALGMVFKHGGI